MEKQYIDIKREFLDFNHKTMNDFEDKEYLRCKCPFCPDYKSPALSIHKSLNFAVCFRCGTLFINKGLPKEEVQETILNLTQEDVSISGITKTPSQLLIGLYDELSPEGNEYLRARNPFVKDWTKYKLRQAENEIFIPYYYLGKFIFYQIRYLSGDRRYNMPSLPSPIYIPSEWDICKDTIICEGPFDAIALDCSVGDRFNIVGVVGKELTKYKRQLLGNLSTRRYFIMLDDYPLSTKIAKGVRNSKIIPTSGPDPEEMLCSMGLDKFRRYILDNTSDMNYSEGVRFSYRYV